MFRKSINILRLNRTSLWLAVPLLNLIVSPAFAAGSGMPWEGPLTTIMDSITGPTAQIIAVLAIAVTGLALAFGDTSGGFRKMIQIVFGISIAFAATTLVTSFFGFAGGATVGTGLELIA